MRQGILLARAVRPTVILPALVLLVYLFGVRGDFLYDDLICVVKNPAVADLTIALRTFGDPAAVDGSGVFTFSAFRPLIPVVHAVVHALFGFNPIPFHALNDLFHAANAALLYLVLLFFLKTDLSQCGGRRDSPPAPTADASSPEFIAAVFAAWWAVHPVQVEAVEFISSIKDVCCGFFFLLTILLFLKGRHFPALLSFLAALLFKETAVMALPIVFLVQVRRRGFSKDLLWKIVPYFAVLALFLFVRTAAIGVAVPGEHWAHSVGSRLATMAEAFFIYLRLLLFPVNLKVNYILPVATRFNGYVIFTVLALAAAAVAFFAFFRRHFAISLGIFWFSACLFPVSNIFPIQTFMNERYLYFPSMGVALLLAAAAPRLQPGKKLFGILIVSIVAALAVLSVFRLQVWRTEEAFLRDIAAKEPSLPGYRRALGEVLLRDGRYAEAAAVYEAMFRTWPDSVEFADALADIYRREGKFAEAEKTLREILVRRPQSVAAATALADFLFDRGRFSEAAPIYEQLAAALPDNAEVRRRLDEARTANGARR